MRKPETDISKSGRFGELEKPFLGLELEFGDLKPWLEGGVFFTASGGDGATAWSFVDGPI